MRCGCEGAGCRIGLGDPRHGTMNGYQNFGCRCVPCRTAHAAWTRDRRALRKATMACPNCDGPGGMGADGTCSACREYLRRHGQPRPPELYDPPPRYCANCGKQLADRRHLRHGRCGACSRYLDRNGVDRPARLWACGEADAADDLHLDEPGIALEVASG